LFNDVPAQFTVINGGHVEVIVPDLGPGVYVIHAVLAPEIGRASFWDGYRVTGRGSSVSTSPVVEKEPPTLVSSPSGTTAQLLAFKGKRVKLSRAVRAELSAIAEASTNSKDEAVIVAYTNKRETKASVRRAKKRARNMKRYLARSGFQGTISIQTEPGQTKAQRRGARILVGTDASVST